MNKFRQTIVPGAVTDAPKPVARFGQRGNNRAPMPLLQLLQPLNDMQAIIVKNREGDHPRFAASRSGAPRGMLCFHAGNHFPNFARDVPDVYAEFS